jgi:type IV pilus assembly protein PilN
VKPIHLNLAARPYRDYRPVYAAVVIMSLLSAFLMLQNIETYYRYTHETSATRAKIADLEVQQQREKQLEQSAQTRLQSIDLAFLDEQTKFVNAKLSERAFSWSTLLDELESVLADDVRLLSVGPTFTPQGIALALAFQAKTGEGMINTINRMHQDPQFVNPFPSNETIDPATGIYSFNLSVGYRPPAAETISAAAVKK